MPTITVINHTRYMQRRTMDIQYIILHYSASIQSNRGSAQQTVSTLDQRGYSSDYAVDDDTIIQFAEDPSQWASTAVEKWSSRKGTAAGKNAQNRNSISIEISSTLDGGKKEDWVANNPHFRFTQKVLDNTAYLCKLLIGRYHIPKENIIRHYDIAGKACPGIVGWNLASGSDNESEYRKFVDSLYFGNSYIPPEPDYEYIDTRSSSPASSNSGSLWASNTNTSTGASNNVVRLASASKTNDDIHLQNDSRKSEFESLRNKMTKDVPDMGRDIIHTSEFYDSNILKSGQESKRDRLV